MRESGTKNEGGREEERRTGKEGGRRRRESKTPKKTPITESKVHVCKKSTH